MSWYAKASMGFYIEGRELDDETDTILGLCYYLAGEIHKSGLVENTFRMVEPDGDDGFEPIGTINVYLHGVKPRDIGKLPGFVKSSLKKIGCDVGPISMNTYDEYAREKIERWGENEQLNDWLGNNDPRVMRFPVTKNGSAEVAKDKPPELNWSNSNAFNILQKTLGFDPQEPMEAWQVVKRIDSINVSQISDGQRDPYDSGEGSGPRIFGQGLSYDDVKRRLAQLRNFAQWALDHGYTRIGAG